MTRLEKFNNLKNHAWYAKHFKKLTNEEIAVAHTFIQTMSDKNRNEFVHTVNRFYLTNKQTKNWSIVSELLTVIG